MNKNFQKILSFVTVIAIFAVFTVSYHFASSSVSDDITQFAWGGSYDDANNNGSQDPAELSGGLGWVSFNSTNDHDPNTPGIQPSNFNYGVNLNTQTGAITGYAWTSNYGWLRFGGLSGFPSNPGFPTGDAHWDSLTGNVTGWAQFCSVAQDPNNCVGTATTNHFNGGWDGWVSLSGPGYQVSLNPGSGGGNFSGYAWGGNDGGKNVVGWIDFSGVSYAPITGPVVTLTANPSTVLNQPYSSTLSWTGLNILQDTDNMNCEATQGPSNWMNPPEKHSPNGTFPTGPLSLGDHLYGIRCQGTSGNWSPESTANVHVGIDFNFHAEPTDAYQANGYHVTLKWEDVNPPGILDNCTATASDAGTGWTGTVAPPNAQQADVFIPDNDTDFTIVCTDNDQNYQTPPKTINVKRNEGTPPPPPPGEPSTVPPIFIED